MAQLTSVSVRMYYTGFGDCFLLTFWYDEPTIPAVKTAKTLWIDFGARAGKALRMQQIAKHLKTHLVDQGLTRNNKPYVDVMAITHEHQDHISGLQQAQTELEGLDIGQVWFAWTEDPKDEMAKAWRKHKKRTREALQKAVQQVQQEVTHLTQQLNHQSAQLTKANDPSQESALEAQLKATDHTTQVADNLAQRLNSMAGFEFATKETVMATGPDMSNTELDFSVNDSYQALIKKVGEDNVRYLRPGYTEQPEKAIPGHIISEGLTSFPSPTIFPGLKLFVLGPPKDLSIIRASEPENWQNSMRADTATEEFNFGQSNFAGADNTTYKDYWYYVKKAPFDEEFVIPVDIKNKALPKFDTPTSILDPANTTVPENSTPDSRQVEKNFGKLQQTKVFEHYFDPAQNWRQINNDYLGSADDMAIKLNTGVNNTSLVLAMEIEQTEEVLFFSGDAEFGVWDDWEQDQKKSPKQRQYAWKIPTATNNKDRTVTVENLMSRTIFYKMGHHGSQNATPNTRGIAKLNSPHLHCLIPVDHVKAESFGWLKIPFQDLLTTLDSRKVPYIRADMSKENLETALERQRPLPSLSEVKWEKDANSDLYVDWTLTLPSAAD